MGCAIVINFFDLACITITETLKMRSRHMERHLTGQIGWLRPAVLGANDVSFQQQAWCWCLQAAHATHDNILLAELPVLSQELCQWLQANTCPSAHRQIPNRLTLSVNEKELETDDSWRAQRTGKRSMSVAALILRLRNR